jgi:Tfp pilus assembly protein PilV
MTEVLVALVITVIAVLGLAHTFGLGRGLIDRYATARDAMGVAQRRMEILRMEARKDLANAELTPGSHTPIAITLDGKISGFESWQVDWVPDPGFPSGTGQDYKKITVTVTWKQSGLDDHIDVSSVLLGQ